MKIYSILLLVIIFTSCNSKEDDFISLFENKVQLKGCEFTNLEHSYLFNPYHMIEIDSCLIFSDPDNYNQLSLFNLRLPDTLIRFGTKGKGPLEIISGGQLSLSFNNKVFELLDISKQKIFYFDIDSILAGNFAPQRSLSIQNKHGKFYKGKPISDGFVGMGDFYDKKYGIYQHNNDTIIFFCDYTFKDLKNVPKETLSLIFQGDFGLNYNRSKFVFSCSTTPLLEIVRLKNGRLDIEKRIYFDVPKVKGIITESYTTYQILEDNKKGFTDMYNLDEYIFLLYSGRTIKEFGEDMGFGRNILVFDWDGNPICNFELDMDISGFSVSNDLKRIYAIGRISEPKIVSFNIENINL
ncbi:MAG TPA: BF3164 family lipoprotein [Bacteroidales bacterium]|nr:BF3164 family lipoprotein [Bacteroidales bacterium]